MMQGTSGEQTPPNQDDSGLALRWDKGESQSMKNSQTERETHAWIAFEMIPIIRPNVAPTAIEGTKIPAGTLQP